MGFLQVLHQFENEIINYAKEYGTYEIDENIVTIVLDGKDSYKCPVVNDGDTFSIVDSSTLSSETLEAFD